MKKSHLSKAKTPCKIHPRKFREISFNLQLIKYPQTMTKQKRREA